MSCELYRHFGDDGKLLYVGISANSISRLLQHKVNSRWFSDLRIISIERFETREQAKQREIEVIRLERPRHNKQFLYPILRKRRSKGGSGMTTAEARRRFGSNNRIATILGIHRSSVGRWKRMVPKRHVDALRVARK